MAREPEMIKEPLWPRIEQLVAALAPYIPDDAARGRVSADLKDLVEASRLLLKTLEHIEVKIRSPTSLRPSW